MHGVTIRQTAVVAGAAAAAVAAAVVVVAVVAAAAVGALVHDQSQRLQCQGNALAVPASLLSFC